MPDRNGYYTPGEALHAAQELGKIVGRVFCAGCAGRAKPLGVVRSSSKGLVFDATIPRGASLPSELVVDVVSEANRLGERLPVPGVVRGRCIVLLQQARRPGADLPQVVCGTHGLLRLEVQRLVTEVLRRSKRAATIRV